MTSEEVRALFARRDRALAAHDVVGYTVDYADDAVLESPSYGTLIGRPAIERMFGQWFTAFPDTTFEQRDLLIEGSRVVQMLTVQGTDTGGFLGQAPTGKPFRFFI